MSTEIDLRITPAEGVTDRYAAASGDHNPIHVDEAFAQSVGLPSRILHGLWSAAQVARAAETVATGGLILGAGDDARYALESLAVQFRGMGVIGPEVVVSGTAKDSGDGAQEVSLTALQGTNKLIRNGRARVRLS